MAEVHEVYSPRRRRRLWPSVVMLLLILLLIGVIVAMIMNIRGSISWPAGGVEFGFRPNIYITRIQPAAEGTAPTRLATDAAPGAASTSDAPAQPSETVAPAETPPIGTPE